MISLQIYHKSYNLCAIASKLSKIFSTSTRSFLPSLSPRFRWGCKGISLFITNKLFLDFFCKFFFLFSLSLTFSFFLSLTHLNHLPNIHFRRTFALFFRAGCKDKRLHFHYQIFSHFFLFLLSRNLLVIKELTDKLRLVMVFFSLLFLYLFFS